MKNIFLDTNFVIDLLLRPEYKTVSQRLLEKCVKAGCKMTISALSVANFAYIARKLPEDQLYDYLQTLMSLFDTAALTKDVINAAIDMKLADFEDALQYQCALAVGADYIITRNIKDFSGVSLPVLSAEQYLNKVL